MSEVEVEALTAAITGVEGVVALHPSDPWRAARVDRDPAPAVRVRGEELKITVRIAVGETAGAEATALRVAAVARSWAATHHPDLTTRVVVRVVTVEPEPAPQA